VLGSVKERYTDLPSVITENGASFRDEPDSTGAVLDTDRVDYLSSYVQAVDDAAADGVAVGGYFAWSLLDNFEWAEGFDKRFGLVYVDFDTQRRTLKSSAHHYAAIVAAHTEQRRPDGAVTVDPQRAGTDEPLEIRSQKATPR
jgi:beta-glucosidase